VKPHPGVGFKVDLTSWYNLIMEIGIVGLPNAGKSTLFNALLGRAVAAVGSHPFTTIKPHEGVVGVPDEKLERLGKIEGVDEERKIVSATVKFIDIAGLVKGAHKGEGLGNQFLGKIREVDAICHVTRSFVNPNVGHFYGSVEPKRDMEIINIELELGGIKKPSLYVLNVDEKQLAKEKGNKDHNGLRHSELGSESILKQDPETSSGLKVQDDKGQVQPVVICAQLEMELGDLTDQEKREYLKELGIKETGLDKLIKQAYQLLDLITFYTIKGGKEIHAWSLKRGETALAAAGEVHTDMARGFIKAEVIGVDQLLEIGLWKKAGERGKIRTEGKDYQVKDGEVIEFRFAS